MHIRVESASIVGSHSPRGTASPRHEHYACGRAADALPSAADNVMLGRHAPPVKIPSNGLADPGRHREPPVESRRNMRHGRAAVRWARIGVVATLMAMRMCRELQLRTCGILSALFVAAAILGSPIDACAAVGHQDAILIQGLRRTFTVYTPDDAAGALSLPIVMVLHGGLGNGSYVARQTGLVNYVDRDKFIAVFPNGKGSHWSDGRSTMSSGPDDVAFLRGVIASIVQKWGGDPGRVFVTGISNGGMMTLRMACDASDIVTAIGVVVANMPVELVNHCRPSRPVPVVLFNGTADPLMPWAGGAIATSRLLDTPGGEVVSAMDTFDFWVHLDGCGPPLADSLPGTRVRRYTSTSCRSGSEVTLYAIDGGGHGWPGGTQPSLIERQISGYVTSEINASAIIVRFFHHYGL